MVKRVVVVVVVVVDTVVVPRVVLGRAQTWARRAALKRQSVQPDSTNAAQSLSVSQGERHVPAGSALDDCDVLDDVDVLEVEVVVVVVDLVVVVVVLVVTATKLPFLSGARAVSKAKAFRLEKLWKSFTCVVFGLLAIKMSSERSTDLPIPYANTSTPLDFSSFAPLASSKRVSCVFPSVMTNATALPPRNPFAGEKIVCAVSERAAPVAVDPSRYGRFRISSIKRSKGVCVLSARKLFLKRTRIS